MESRRVGGFRCDWETMNDMPEHLTATQAREGTGPSSMRYVLGGGLLLVIVIFAVILFAAA